MIRKVTIWLLPVILIQLLSCAATRNLPEGEVLYTGMSPLKIEKVPYKGEKQKIYRAGFKKANAYLYAFKYPNGSLGWPIKTPFSPGILMYNLFYTEKTRGFSRWMMTNFGEPPRTISWVNPELVVKNTENFLFNLGHFDVSGNYNLKYSKNGKKAWVKYQYKIPKAYAINDVGIDQSRNFPSLSSRMEDVLKNDKSRYIEFNLLQLEETRSFLFNHLVDNGYYSLRQENIMIAVDTTIGNRNVDIRFRLNESSPPEIATQYKIRGYTIQVDTTMKSLKPGQIFNGGEERLNQVLFHKSVHLNPGEFYSMQRTANTRNHLTELGIFSEIRINYNKVPSDSTLLDADIVLSTLKPMKFDFDASLTSKNTGFIGPSLGLELSHGNLFGSAQKLTIGAEGYYDFPTGVFSENSPTSYGYTLRADYASKIFRTIAKRESLPFPERRLSLSFEHNIRDQLLDIINTNADYTISFQARNNIHHSITPFMLDLYRVSDRTPGNELPIDSLARFIFGGGYKVSFNNSFNDSYRFRYKWDSELEIAGNMLNSIAATDPVDPSIEKEIFGIPFSQYARFRSEFKFYLDVGYRQQIAFRNIIGVTKAYGNSDIVPFIKQFYIGGSNSLRPIAARTIGPGRYLEFNEQVINQLGDIKFETNLEYRFPLGLKANGAIWTDAGNIWLFDEDPARPGSGFQSKNFISDHYLTSGIGVRLDLKYVVLRVDYGALLYAPIFPEGLKWLWQNGEGFNLTDVVFGIGYPF